MVDENNCCSCTTPEITIKLNKQGPQGLVGPQGNPGFSPVITVEEDTSTNYKLNIQTEQGSFITPNLKGSIPAGGSAGSVLTRTESGGAEFAPLPYATTSTSGTVVFATQEDIEEGETGLAVNSSSMSNYYTKTQADNKYVDLTSDQDVNGRKRFSDLRTNSIAERNGNSYISYHRDGVDSNLNSVTIGGTNTPNVYINRGGLIGTNIDSNNIGSYALTSLPIASTSTLGGVKVDGTTITIDTNGVISSQGGGSSYTAGNGIDITNDEISIDTSVVATQSDIPTNYVTTDTQQAITGLKRITSIQLPASFTDGILDGSYSIPILTTKNGYTTIGNNSSTYSNLILAGRTITTRRKGETTSYINIDSGNLSANLPTATNSSLGVVKPDGTTVTIDANGTLSALGSTPSNMVTLDTTQTISGAKTFSRDVTLRVGDPTSAENIFLLNAYMCSRINDSGVWDTYTGMGRILTYRHPLQSEQGILEIGSTGATNYNDTEYYYAGKLRLVAPEILTRYDGTNEYEVLDENNIATNTTIAGLTSRISTLESTITALTNRITALETAINGGNA